ncbi:MAG: GspH/FimT family pseudopilin [Burkholderiales bacterium]|jgi:Tfp pilus assembly protein FimT|nr:GspH/FimT family pseudopilin [Burkholderiales bacterium]
MTLGHQRATGAGFTVLELTVTVAVFAVVVAVSAPSIGEWIGKLKVHTNAEALKNSIVLAQGEAIKRNRLVEFSLVNVIPPAADSIPADNGMGWIVRVLPFSTETITVLQADTFAQQGVQLTGGNNKTLVFSGVGEVYTSVPSVDDPEPVLLTTRAYQVVSSSGYSTCVLVQPGKAVRWCDPTIVSGSHACPGSATQSCL